MRTRIEKEVVTVNKTIYIACDGKEFDDNIKCSEYEKWLNRTEQEKQLEEIEAKHSLDDVTPLDGAEYYEGHDYRWYRPKSIEEIDLLNDYYGLDSGYLTKEHIGEWVCIEAYDIYNPNEACYVSHISSSIKQIEFLFNELGYDVTIKKREANEINLADYTIEYCPFCDTEQVIYAKGVTACPNCGKPLAPCSMCENCDYSTCPCGCTGGAEDEFKKVTNEPISKEQAKELYKLLV